MTSEQAISEVIARRNKHVLFTDDEKEQAENRNVIINKKIDKLEKALIIIEEQEKIRKTVLDDMSNDKISNIVYTILIRQPVDKIINNLIVEFVSTESETVKDKTDVVKYEEYIKKLNEEKQQRFEELQSLSKDELIFEATNKKSKTVLVKYVIFEEFFLKKQKITKKLIGLKTEQRNIENTLKSGKYTISTIEYKLTYKERLYKNSLVLHIRRLELQTWSHDQLVLHEGVLDKVNGTGNETGIGVSKKNLDVNQKLKLIENILLKEFPDQNIFEKLPKTTETSMKSVLLTLDEDQINILAYNYGIKNPEERGKHNKINYIIHFEYPKLKKMQTKELVYGKVAKNFNYVARKEKLEEMDPKEIKALAVYYGFTIKNKNTSDLITMILNNEESVARLITKDEFEKTKLIEKISNITGQAKTRYVLWSLE